MLKYVQQGEPFSPSASQTNAFVDAAIYVRNLRHGAIGQSTVPTSDDFLPVWIRNSTGLPVGRWGVLKIGDPVVLPSDNQADFEESIIFEGVLPTVSDDDTHAIVVQQLEANQVGVAVLSGVVTVKINVTDVAHRRAKTIASDAAKLESGDVGAFKILWKESGTGEKWAKVILDSDIGDSSPNEIFAATLNGDLLAAVTPASLLAPELSAPPIDAINYLGLTGADGDTAIVWREIVAELPVYRLIAVHRRDPVWIKGQLDNDMCTSSGVPLKVGAVAIGGFPLPVVDSNLNDYDLKAIGSEAGLAVVDITNDDLTWAQVAHKEFEVADTYEYDDLTCTLVAKTKIVAAMSCDADGSDDAIFTGVAIDVGVGIEVTTGQLQLQLSSICALPGPGTPSVDGITLEEIDYGDALTYSDPNLCLEFDKAYVFPSASAGKASDCIAFEEFECPDAQPAPLGHVARFDGVDDYVSFATITPVTVTGTYTISVWVRPDSTLGIRSIFQHGVSSTDRAGILLDGVSVLAGIDNGSATWKSISAFSSGEWIHVAMTNNSGTLRLFVNGVEATGTQAQTLSASDKHWGNSDSAMHFQGSLRDARIYSVVKTPAEIIALHGGTDDVTDIVLQHTFDHASGTTVVDAIGSNDGTAVNITESTFWEPY